MIAKSPIFSQMTATLTGISTIRATKAEERLILEFDDFQNVHSAVWQMLMSVNTGRCCKAINNKKVWTYKASGSSHFLSHNALLFIVALGLWLDCVSCTFVACVCYSFIVMSQEDTSSSNVGLAISQALILTGMVQYGIRQMMESFQLFTNTERVLQYTRLEQEPLISRKPTLDWPFKGISRFNVELNLMNFYLIF